MGKRILHRIADRLGDDQSKRHSLIAVHLQLGRFNLEMQAIAFGLSHGLEQLFAEFGKKTARVYRVQLALEVEMAVQSGQRPDAVARGLKLRFRLRLPNATCL